MKTLDDFFSPSEAAYRWGIKIETLQEKMKPGRQGDKLQQWQNEGLLKYFAEPGKQRGVWILTREIMEMWYGEEPKNEKVGN